MKKPKPEKFYFDVEPLFLMEGLFHVAVVDVKNTVLRCNNLLSQINKEVLGLDEKNVCGRTIEDIFYGTGNAAEVVYEENEAVTRERSPKNFYNFWTVKDIYNIELLTLKMPIYQDRGELAGVLCIAQYINKFSLAKAQGFGLTKREIDCLSQLLKGGSTKKIAASLNLSRRTVEHYIDSLKDKLGCLTQSELIFKVLEYGFKEDLKSDQCIISNEIVTNPKCSEDDNV